MLASEPRETPARLLAVQVVPPSPAGPRSTAAPELLPGETSCADPLLQTAPCLPSGDTGQ